MDVSDPPYFKVYYDRPATAENPPRKMVALLAPKEDRDGNVIGYYADTSSLGETGRGADFYQAAFAWAKANKVKLQPDDVLTLINTFRRTEQMLSAALRLGTTKWMNPHLDQRIYGWNENPKNQQEDDENLGRLILATVRNLEESVPEAYKVWYNPTSGKFGGDDGRTLDYGTEVSPILAAGAARSAGIGRSTLARVCWPETSSLESWTPRQWHAAMAQIFSGVGMLPSPEQVEPWLAKTPQFAIEQMRKAMAP
ncbi:MAG: hypothetical protein IPG25_16360 [Proteobacteria bacterium]|nr:hypothetical protein [Pseudomonadota bacterium]